MSKISPALLAWRKKQGRGKIMKPSTFQEIKEGAAKKYGSEERGEKAAGAAYWATAKSKYKEGQVLGKRGKR